MPITVKESKGGKLKIAGADNNTPAQRKELERLAQLELRKVGTDKRDEWFEEKYKGEKVAGPDAFKSAMGHDWGEGEVSDKVDEGFGALGIKRVRVYSPKDLEDLERLREPAVLNWGGMEPEAREWIIESSEGDLSGDDAATIASVSKYGPLKDRNRIRGAFKNKGKAVDSWDEISKHPQFDVRGWRFDASQHQGGETTENLPWAERYRDGGPSSRATWNKYIRPYFEDDGETLGLMWINPRMPKGLTAERVINDYLSFNEKPNIFKRTDAVIGESTRLAEQGDKEKDIKGKWDTEEAYRKEASELLGGKVPSGDEWRKPSFPQGLPSPSYTRDPVKKPSPLQRIHIRSAEEEERKLMEEPLKKGKK